MSRVLLLLGIGCCFVAIITGLISLDVDSRGLSEVNPLGALAIAVAGLACFRGYAQVSEVERRAVERRRSADAPQGR